MSKKIKLILRNISQYFIYSSIDLHFPYMLLIYRKVKITLFITFIKVPYSLGLLTLSFILANSHKILTQPPKILRQGPKLLRRET
ncbi:hypothetical protein FLAVO9AF_40022 [Flavobacterium sp. 9AF]|nr:hypothetical protein FLAVO9AF_40022 [Flavobacterium sp. 9AF]